MSNTLEPLPTKQLATVKNIKPKAAIVVEKTPTSEERSVYPWLLGASTCLSMVLCWMYVTKPVIAASANNTGEKLISAQENLVVSSGVDASTDNLNVESTSEEVLSDDAIDGLMPLNDSLPGSSSNQESLSSSTSDAQVVAQEPSRALTADSLLLNGWEKTNHNVQHVLQADLGNGSLEKIFVEVPVFYQTRTMGWQPNDVAAARDLLKRLMLYEASINQLKLEGESMLTEWNSLLERTVPTSALRADSPSLPYNHSLMAAEAPLSGSESLIKIDQ